MVRGDREYTFVKDALGSVRQVLDSNGVVMQAISYDAWGVPTATVGSLEYRPFGFAGGLYDSDTGLVRFGARDYDAEVGRWTAKDPIRFGGGQANLYAYVGNDPMNLTDPTGFWAISFGGTAGFQFGLGYEASLEIYIGRTHLGGWSGGIGISHGPKLGFGYGGGFSPTISYYPTACDGLGDTVESLEGPYEHAEVDALFISVATGDSYMSDGTTAPYSSASAFGPSVNVGVSASSGNTTMLFTF